MYDLGWHWKFLPSQQNGISTQSKTFLKFIPCASACTTTVADTCYYTEINQTVHCAIMVYQSGWWGIYHTQYNEIERRGVWIDSMTKCTQDMQTQTDLCDHSIVSKHCVGKKSLQLFTNFPYYYGFNAPTMLEITNVSFQFSKRLQITLKKNATKLAVKCSSDINFLNHRNGKV